MTGKAYLVVQQGEPYTKGYEIELSSFQLLIGRPWQAHRPEIAFSSVYVSKRHALICCRDNQFTITDLGSKHGTQVNGRDLLPNYPYPIQNGDIIVLAKGAVRLVFKNPFSLEVENTVDLERYAEPESATKGLVIDPLRRQVFVEGREVVLYGKDIDLLLTLFERRNCAVSYDEIRCRVWPERPAVPPKNVPDVGTEEINALVYRLRKKLGQHGSKIITVPRFGYRLDL